MISVKEIREQYDMKRTMVFAIKPLLYYDGGLKGIEFTINRLIRKGMII